jgi:5-hydroxyisourate hydrolase
MSQITTHILDTACGRPAAGVHLALYRATDDAEADTWEHLAGGVTNSDGRVAGLLDASLTLPAGRYRMHFAVADYFASRGQPVFYPYVDVVFDLDASGEHYHIPLLLSPFGYSTYRGS